ncbi:Arylsulfatase [Thalassoglobus neptunius]|uniref:Arylsulfatase n=1 Tax=Thalassoglobus neptunius TaxID=1938619 RepID=A0A5C5X903_9PLAN|nr:arylsulfatase [Thalassoglobus neptunius]TWT58352.1 Arylsulfatase [Thalassoglobus neptunius]
MLRGYGFVVVSSLAFMFAWSGEQASFADESKRPNIVFILADDLGIGDLGFYGQERIQTPHIDQMFSEGMEFTQHYSGSTVCAPSRSCLMTGLHTGHTYMRGNGAEVVLRDDPEDRTVASALQEAGYATAMIGKSCVSGGMSELDLPNRKGFDHFFGVLSHTEAHHYFPKVVYRNGQTIPLPGNSEHEGDQYCHDLYLEEAKNWIREHSDESFFLLYSAHIPHVSLYAPEEWKEKYRGKFEETPVTNQKHYRNEPEPLTTWAAMVSRLDWEVGQILKTLNDLNIAENTLVIFTSDNGATEAGGHSEKSFESSGLLRGAKRDLYEGGIRTPMVAWWPGTIPAGSDSDHISAFWDFFPTACELAGADVPSGLDGISYAPTLLGNNQDQQQHPWLYWEFFEKGGKRAVRMGNWKAVQLDMLKKRPSPIELYHLGIDPRESNDVAEDYPNIVEVAKQIFEEARTESPISRFNWSSDE